MHGNQERSEVLLQQKSSEGEEKDKRTCEAKVLQRLTMEEI
jgi:hypothetical protein